MRRTLKGPLQFVLSQIRHKEDVAVESQYVIQYGLNIQLAGKQRFNDSTIDTRVREPKPIIPGSDVDVINFLQHGRKSV